MQISEVRGYIGEEYRAGRHSVLLLGPAGIGKSVAIKEAAIDIAAALNKTFVDFAACNDDTIVDLLENPDKYFLFHDFRMTEVEPSDLLGIPQKVTLAGQEVMHYIPLKWARCLARCAGILDLDEFTQVNRLDVQAASYKIVLDKRAGDTYFSPEVMIVAAGNSPDDSSIANLLSAPLVNRFTKVNVERPTLVQWTGWMDRTHEKWDKRVLGYLQQFDEDLLAMPKDPETLENFPTPRSWTRIATTLKDLPEKYQLEAACGKLGDAVGMKLHAYLHTDIPDIEVLLAEPRKFDGLDLNGQYLAATFAGSWLSEHCPERVDDKFDPKGHEIMKAIPLIKHMATSEKGGQEFVILSLLATGKNLLNVAPCLSRGDKELADCMQKVTELASQLEYGT